MKHYLDRLALNVTVVTATERLARAIEQAWDRRQAADPQAGAGEAWDRPAVYSWKVFLRRCWDDAVHRGEAGSDPPALLSTAQELELWSQVVRSRLGGPEALFDVSATAREARRAYGIVHEYCMQWPPDPSQCGDDHRAFAEWVEGFESRCRELGRMPLARLPWLLTRALGRGARPTVGDGILLAGFDQLTPAARGVCRALGAAGVHVSEIPFPEDPDAEVVRTPLPTVREELRAAARWARRQLESEPRSRVAVVVPDLGALRNEVSRVFSEVLEPARSLAAGGAGSPRAWKMSLGPPLAEYPMVDAALAVLRFAAGRPPADLAGRVVRSPYLAHAEEERFPRAVLDRCLRKTGEPRVGLAALARLAREADRHQPERPAPHACPHLASLLDALRGAQPPAGASRTPAEWAEHFADVLRLAGWPGERSLGSEEYQLLVRWGEALDVLAGFDAVTGAISQREAVDRLQRLLRDEVFQPKGAADPPVQVLGVLEAGGMTFDRVWVAGMHDGAWPPPRRPSAFVPPDLQEGHGVPEATAAGHLERALAITGRLKSCARKVVFSWAQWEGEEELRMSPLLRDVRERSTERLALSGDVRVSRSARVEGACEEIADGQGPGVPAGSRVRGGTGALADQAACPFKGFARHQLAARALDDYGLGVDPRVRGELLHRVLELVWGELGDARTLEALDGDALRGTVRRCARQAVDEQRGRRREALQDRFAEMEVERLVRTVMAWLDLERQREPFSVEGREDEALVDVGGLTFSVRLDRVDRFESGGLAIIDYKTGFPVTPDWFGDRPAQLQLPLYAVCAPGGERVDAVCLAFVRSGKSCYRGVARSDKQLTGVKPIDVSRSAGEFDDLDALLAWWRDQLDVIAGEIRSGRADVWPKKPAETCRHCDLRVLCRRDEKLGTQAWIDGDDEAVDGGSGDG